MNTHNHPIHLTSYNSEWSILFQKEKELISSALTDYIDKIEHIGSTSIPGLSAKPIIDIMIGAKKEEFIDKCINPLISLGYEYREQTVVDIPGRKFFKKYIGVNTGYHVHLVEINKDFWIEHLLFRDYLRTHPNDTKSYEELKKNLAKKFKHDRKAYLDGKNDLIQEIMKKAHKEVQYEK